MKKDSVRSSYGTLLHFLSISPFSYSVLMTLFYGLCFAVVPLSIEQGEGSKVKETLH